MSRSLWTLYALTPTGQAVYL